MYYRAESALIYPLMLPGTDVPPFPSLFSVSSILIKGDSKPAKEDLMPNAKATGAYSCSATSAWAADPGMLLHRERGEI